MELSDIHDCQKCHGKIVGITIDMFGNSHCSYCGEVVDYKPYFKDKFKEDIK